MIKSKHIKQTYLYKAAKYIQGLILSYRDHSAVNLLLPAAPDEYTAIKLYPYWWFSDIEQSFHSRVVYNVMKKYMYVCNPAFGIMCLKDITYDNYFSKYIRSSERALIRKALKNGFTCRPIKYDDYLPEIYEINTSKEERNGHEMSYDYTHVRHRDAIVSKVNAEVYTYGCFSETGSLVAYYMFEKITNFYHVVKGIGHLKYLPYGIMNYLFAYCVDVLAKMENGAEYVVYGVMSEEHGTGLNRYKHNVGLSVRHVFFSGTSKQKNTLTYFNSHYALYGDSSMNFVLDYIMEKNDPEKSTCSF